MGARTLKFIGLGIAGVLAILALVIAGFLVFMAVWGFTVPVTEADLQSAMNKRLPETESYGLVEVTYNDGTVALKEDSSRIYLELDVDVTAAGVPGTKTLTRGTVYMSSDIGYDENDSVLYLKDPRLEDIEIEGVPPLIEGIVNTALETLSVSFLDSRIAVEDFTDNDVASWFVRNLLKDIKVEGGEVKVKFAL